MPRKVVKKSSAKKKQQVKTSEVRPKVAKGGASSIKPKKTATPRQATPVTGLKKKTATPRKATSSMAMKKVSRPSTSSASTGMKMKKGSTPRPTTSVNPVNMPGYKLATQSTKKQKKKY